MIPIRSKKCLSDPKNFILIQQQDIKIHGYWVSKLVVNTKLKYNYVKSLDVKKKQ